MDCASFRQMYAALAKANPHTGFPSFLAKRPQHQRQATCQASGGKASKAIRCPKWRQPAGAAICANKKAMCFGLHLFPNSAGPLNSAMTPRAARTTRLGRMPTLARPTVPTMVGGVKRKVPPTSYAKTSTDKNKEAHASNKKACHSRFSRNNLPTLARPTALGEKPAIGDRQPTISKWLEDMRQDRVQRATWKKGKLFVDLFSGKRSPVGRQVGKRGGAYIAFDILIDGRFDLGHPEVLETLTRWIRQGLVWGVWFGTDCTTWSKASWSKGPGWINSYRSQHHLWGELASLNPKAREKVLQGNAHAHFTMRVLQQVADQPLAVAGLENPAGSVIWQLPEMRALEKGSRFHHSICHYCQYGTRWQKPTRLLFVGGDKALAPHRMCKRKGKTCSKTGLPHLQLGGGRRHPSSGKELTKLATEYPPQLAAKMVDCLASCP